MFKIIAIVVVVLIVVLLIYAATRPDVFRIQRSIAIKAPPGKVFALIDDFHAWTQWSPWENIDPNLKRTYSGTASGKGTIYAWEGNSKVGSGRMEIADSAAPQKILIKLDFLKPFEAHNTAEFTLTAQGDTTTVDWAMYGPSPYISKVMGVLCNMDKMVGGQFETGLANLKRAAEK